MNSSYFDSESSSRENDPLTSDFDFLETATQYLNTTDGFFRNAPTSLNDDQEQSSSTSSYPPASAFHSPARSQHSQHNMSNQRSADTSSASAASWNSTNANSQMSTYTPSFISHYMIPWQQEEEKPSSWDDESDDEEENEPFRDEPQAKMGKGSDASVVSKRSRKKSRRKSPGVWDLLCMEIEIPIQVAYAVLMLLIGLTGLCFVIGYKSEQQGKQRNSMASLVLTPVAPPASTLAPTVMTAMPSPAPSVPATLQPTQCNKNILSVDKLCYVAGDDGILLEFDVCNTRESDWIAIYPMSTTILLDDYEEWSWSCGTKLCEAYPKTNDFVISTERLLADGLYRAYYMRYNNDGTPFASVAMSEIFQISNRCM
ncbi:unnamed protein product [Cylindrotheca closterium]|uniref:Uncharacterized protein n=1 Tax=Cylindrotheca closterium TaxID=2856 RepID=A0AAD2CC72_9STRA|nr:unnamed protein product [Cylindrotheca closterium]